MGDIIRFPGKVTRPGYKRVRKSCRETDPNQLELFPATLGAIAAFEGGLSIFEQALKSEARGDSNAADLYLQSIERGECVADAYCNLGILECKAQNISRAFNHFTSCLQHEPRHLEAHYNLATLYMDLHDYRLARVHFELAIEIDPAFSAAYFSLGIVLSTANELAAALAVLARYQELASAEEGRSAEELILNIRRALSARETLDLNLS